MLLIRPPPAMVRVRSYTHPRTASLAITLSGAAVHAALAIQVVALWRSPKWEPESEWESAHDEWRVDSIKVLWALLSAYFASSAVVSALGFYGIAKVRCHPERYSPFS